jgi:hypothetical protein
MPLASLNSGSIATHPDQSCWSALNQNCTTGAF